jgi:hypothetical protein
VILRRPGHAWPVLLAANRDEMLDRPWLPPARHWPDRPEVVGGRDELAGGTWLGLNNHGVVAGILNRQHSLGPAAGMRSRGELVLEALDHADAAQAAAALAGLDTRAYRPFNLVIADNRDAYWLRNRGPDGPGRIETGPIPVGIAMITAHDMGDMASPRIRAYLPRFQVAPPPDPDRSDWVAWEALLASRDSGEGDSSVETGPAAAMAIRTPTGFGTVCGSLLGLPSPEAYGRKPTWRFAPGLPGEVPWVDIRI